MLLASNKTNRPYPNPFTYLPAFPQASPSQTGPISQSQAQAPGRSSCGTSSWSCCRRRNTRGWLPGRETMVNLWSKTQTRWQDCGAFGSANLTWTTTSSVERLGMHSMCVFHIQRIVFCVNALSCSMYILDDVLCWVHSVFGCFFCVYVFLSCILWGENHHLFFPHRISCIIALAAPCLMLDSMWIF